MTPKQILRLRDKELRLSQSVFGAYFGVDQSTVHRWETIGPSRQAAVSLKRLRDDVAAGRVTRDDFHKSRSHTGGGQTATLAAG